MYKAAFALLTAWVLAGLLRAAAAIAPCWILLAGYEIIERTTYRDVMTQEITLSRGHIAIAPIAVAGTYRWPTVGARLRRRPLAEIDRCTALRGGRGDAA